MTVVGTTPIAACGTGRGRTDAARMGTVRPTGDGYTGTIGGTSIFPGITITLAPTPFSGFTVDAGASIPGDVTRWVGGTGVARLTYTQDGCSPAQVSIPVSAAIVVWDRNSLSAGGAMAGAYSITVTATRGVPVVTDCGGTPVRLVACLYAMSTDRPGTLANSQTYVDPARLAGSACWNCAADGLSLGATMTWSLTR